MQGYMLYSCVYTNHMCWSRVLLRTSSFVCLLQCLSSKVTSLLHSGTLVNNAICQPKYSVCKYYPINCTFLLHATKLLGIHFCCKYGHPASLTVSYDLPSFDIKNTLHRFSMNTMTCCIKCCAHKEIWKLACSEHSYYIATPQLVCPVLYLNRFMCLASTLNSAINPLLFLITAHKRTHSVVLGGNLHYFLLKCTPTLSEESYQKPVLSSEMLQYSQYV